MGKVLGMMFLMGFVLTASIEILFGTPRQQPAPNHQTRPPQPQYQGQYANPSYQTAQPRPQNY